MKLFLVAIFLIAAMCLTAETASVGEEPCTRGPSYWCGSIQAATSCQAFSYCLKNVWKAQEGLRLQETKDCLYSQKAIKSVKQLLTEDKGLEDAAHLIASMCSSIRENSRRKECKTLVNYFRPQILDLMESPTEPATVAAVMRLCTPPQEAEPTGMPQASQECELCELLVGTVDQLLTENKTEQAIQQVLENVCRKLPSGIMDQCLSFVDEYIAMVIQLLVQEELDPHQVCLALKLCLNSADSLITAPSESSGGLCTVCELIIGILEVQVASNMSEEEIEKALDKICVLLPSSLASTCQSFVKMYLPAVINMVEKKHPPSEICALMSFCNATVTGPVAVPSTDQSDKASTDPVNCELCKAIITEINGLLGDNQLQQAIIQAVEKVCDILQGDLKLQCQSEVQNYGPAVLDLLQHMDDPSEVCIYLHQCTSASSTKSAWNSLVHHNGQPLLGNKECTWGPSFWCANLENARKCGMEQECVERYGMKP